MFFQSAKTLLVTGLVGIVLVLCASSNFVSSNEYKTIGAEIKNIEFLNPEYKISVNYTIDGVSYNSSYNTNSLINKNGSVNNIGETILINYEKSNYNNITEFVSDSNLALHSCISGAVCLFVCFLALIQFNNDVDRTTGFVNDYVL